MQRFQRQSGMRTPVKAANFTRGNINHRPVETRIELGRGGLLLQLFPSRRNGNANINVCISGPLNFRLADIDYLGPVPFGSRWSRTMRKGSDCKTAQ